MLNRILVPTPFHRNMVWILSGPATLVGCICFPVLMTIGQPHQAIWDKLIKNAKCRDPLCSTLRSISSSMENASDEDASPPLPSESGDERSLIRLDNDIVL
ncbi:hypothetical protein BDDG_01009 [Blastomyces dermatitidis ATCC 18188]|uniref:Uncharacterized protein n=1 Tax=Ajellomyces dermatitidis (strain ATCC 18188 / CBS 674.68) TaxID=653446 RepID=F2T3S0_AJEDA|nr:hypothetical protein BDDG_01009 [Blastomyces dermatitidis ATCC 18188]